MNFNNLKSIIKKISNYHRPSDNKNIFLFTMPRSGSTWLMELLSSQPSIKYCNEPLYLNNALVKKYLKIENWEDLHDETKLEIIYSYFKKLNTGKLGFLNPNPFGDYYRPLTNRIVFKIIHGGRKE